MRYVVTWPKASFHVVPARGKPRNVVVEKGGDVPDGVDAKTLEALVVAGAIAAAAVDTSSPLDTNEPPAKSAKVGDWRTYATVKGLDEEIAKKATKDQLVAFVEEGTVPTFEPAPGPNPAAGTTEPGTGDES